ncbi:hypothetical protein AFCA_000494 [Aspergillus flavus]|uniref:Zn(2)-C6 fungal-type domain-containing protein n=1 Tax=Aspergillus flavus TaxID=5059 RepID=A0AB74CNZ2_ASPFL|nr:hypothetical protein CA14_010796 [Aspergillus flavus]UCK57575.1 hypothetical protein AFCA_000494 [Aspergillus flavus]
MVYCGRPSTSCNNCRAKKRRCDKAVPGCGQCRRMGQQCPGYRDPTSLIFRDESSQVGDKVRARITKRDASRGHTPGSVGPSQGAGLQVELEQGLLNEDPVFTDHSQSIVGNDALQVNNTSPDFNNASSNALERGTSSSRCELGSENVGNDEQDRAEGKGPDNQKAIPPPFALPLDMIGLNYFLAHYVVRQSPPSPGFLDYVPSILTLDDENEILQGAILAVGFAGLAHRTCQVDLRCRSRAMYTRTIKRMNKALTDPQTARRHSTIVTVLVLSLYEFGESSLNGWDQHIQGATSLLRLRGKAQFTTPIGLQIFKDIFSHLLINCLRMGSAIPSPLRMIRAEAAKAISASDPYWVASSGLVEIMDLYSQILPGGFDFIHSSEAVSNGTGATERQLPIDELERYLSQALDIDHRLESRFSECSPEWQFTVMQLTSPDPTRVHGDAYHSYHDAGIVGVWNDMRTCRVLANHAICHLLLRGAKSDPSWFFSKNYTDQLQETSRTMRQIRDDILASVPQQMSYFPFPAQAQLEPVNLEQYFNQMTVPGTKWSDDSWATFNSSPGFEHSTYTGAGVGAYFASWMLLLAGCMHTNSEDTRQWIVAQLRHISLQSGLAQADFFADCVQSSKVRPPLST